MSSEQPAFRTVIESLGGPAELARRLSTPDFPLTKSHTGYWYRCGIPPKWEDVIQAVLKSEKLPPAPPEAFPQKVRPSRHIAGYAA